MKSIFNILLNGSLALSCHEMSTQKEEPVISAQSSLFKTKLPEDAPGNKTKEEVCKIQEFFEITDIKGRLQFPIPESACMWQNMGRMYKTVDVIRGGSIRDLTLAYEPEIGNIAFEGDGKQETVDCYLDSFLMDAFLVAHSGKIVFERYKTMRPQDKHIWYSSGWRHDGVALTPVAKICTIHAYMA